MKYILVTGGVISGVGKGVIASSFGTLLKSCGLDVTSIKIDPYINIDAGTFSPYEHEVVLKAKWKGLRDNFRVEYKRIPRSDSGEFLVEPATFESKWIHYYALLFLTEHMRHRVPKNEQDQSFFFAQQSQDCEKTVVEPDLTNGLIGRIQDSDEEFDEDDVEEDEDEVTETTPPAAHSQPLSSFGSIPGAIIKTEDTRNLLKNIDKEVQDLSKKSLDNNAALALEASSSTLQIQLPQQQQQAQTQLQQATSISSTTAGEVYVLDDGGEVDLDLGNYERFLDVTLHRDNNITTGKIYQLVIEKERKGEYLGKTVQVVPHITDAIQEWVERVAETPVRGNSKPQVCIVELGGTIGDIEGMPFVEAFRQFQFRVKRENFCVAHVSLVPSPSSTGEPKTKPTQSSVRELRGFGLSPDLIVCRSEKPIGLEVKEKISNFCHVAPDQVICIHDLSSIYHVPLLMEQNGVIEFLNERLQLNILPSKRERCLQQWKDLARRSETLRKNVTIALVGKYTKFKDSYASVVKALQHAALAAGYNLNLNFIDSSLLENATLQEAPSKYHKEWQMLCESDGVLVPGGFGSRGIEGKIKACQWCRENRKPYLGICLGLQAAVIEFARNVLGLKDAHTTEIEPKTANALVIDMPEHHTGQMGGTMRLGKRTTIFSDEPSIIKQLYGNPKTVDERHRHRYEVNPKYVPQLEEHGMRFVGCDDTNTRMEVIELRDHPFYVGTQYHPEYLSRPLKPSPPFLGLILASVGRLPNYIAKGCRLSPRQQSDVSSDEDELLVADAMLRHSKMNGNANLTPNGKVVLMNGSTSTLDTEINGSILNADA